MPWRLWKVGFSAASAREFLGVYTDAHAFFHYDEGAIRNITATFMDCRAFNLNAIQSHAFAEWASTVVESKWFILLSLVGSPHDASLVAVFNDVVALAQNLHVKGIACVFQTSDNHEMANHISQISSSLPFILDCKHAASNGKPILVLDNGRY